MPRTVPSASDEIDDLVDGGQCTDDVNRPAD